MLKKAGMIFLSLILLSAVSGWALAPVTLASVGDEFKDAGGGASLTYSVLSESDAGGEVELIRDFYAEWNAPTGGGPLTRIAIPASVAHDGKTYAVTKLGGMVFVGAQSLREVIIPGTVTEIRGTFQYCAALESVSIPPSVAVIGEGAFYGCEALRAVSIPSTVRTIGAQAFYVCRSLEGVAIPDGVTAIGDWAFAACDKMTEITIPASVTRIDGNPFHSVERRPENFTIRGVPGSAAERLAIAYGYQFKSVTSAGVSSAQSPAAGVSSAQITARPGLLITDQANHPIPSDFSGALYKLALAAMPTDRATLEYYYVNAATALNESSPEGFEGYWDIQSDHPEIIKLAKKITAGQTNDYQKALAIHDWVAGNIYYDLDAARDWSQFGAGDASAAVLERGRGTCGGFANLTAALLRASGVPADSVGGIVNISGPGTNHGWTEAFADGRWILIDTTWDVTNYWQNGGPSQTGGEGAAPSRLYFDTPLADFALSHRILSLDGRAYTHADGGTLVYAIPEADGSFTVPEGITTIGAGAPNYNGIFWYPSTRKLLSSVKIPDTVRRVNGGAFEGCISLKEITIPSSVVLLDMSSFIRMPALRDVILQNPDITINPGAFDSGEVTFHGAKGSEVEKFAGQYGFRFKELGGQTAASSGQPIAAATAASPAASVVLVNGEPVALAGYNIGGSTYFKLRDLAYGLNSTAKRFSVGWDAAGKAITLTLGQAYKTGSGEPTGKEAAAGNKTSTPADGKIYIDGVEARFTAYNIDGNNYFRLRDIGQALDFNVAWDGGSDTIAIDTGKGYA
ncbi:MAG: leucine-rich repeat protein [Peptococcaceae bacterium]|jgi:transglutaminase-like putative cysteine protease|nr:leucine-rich repeat protein [Peptococcaceae bacterium]